MVTAEEVATSGALTAKLTVVDPAGTVTLDGSEISDELHEIDIWLPPGGAAEFNVMLAVAVEPAGSIAGSRAIETTCTAVCGAPAWPVCDEAGAAVEPPPHAKLHVRDSARTANTATRQELGGLK